MSVSLILPYWDRQEAADKALALLAETYAGLDLEVIVVDDGNPAPFRIPDTTLNLKVLRLAEKTGPKCPVTAWNAGVRYASHDLIALSCIEILHEKPVLAEMAAQVRNMGPLGYVLAAAWCPEAEQWHCHSTVKTPRNPTGTGIAFCGMLHRDLFDRAGGFDEAYREGAGYEDNDFINRLLVAGARFVIRDDLVITHPKSGASIAWGAEKFAVNEAIYRAKWPAELRLNSITFCCVNVGDYLGRGREYVEKLYAMLHNCLPDGLASRFVCFTDDPFEHESIECRLPPGLPFVEGWHQKIALFKSGVFDEGERVVYFDLDTLLVGRLDRILDYQGEFAVLRDFWRPGGLGPAVMCWRGGFGAWIWEEYERAGYPKLARGDQEWLEWIFARDGHVPNILQDLYPGFFCSYKDSAEALPDGARVVCFHGTPRPHEVTGWAAEAWNGRLTGSALEMLCNTEKAQILSNIRSSSARNIPWLASKPAHRWSAILVGGGPSLANSLDEIRDAARGDNAATVIAMNGSADYLLDNGIRPDIHIAVDARESNLKFVQRRSAGHYYLASQCHPAVFDALPGATLFHIALAGMQWDEFIPKDRGAIAIGGGHSVGLYAMSLAYVLGFREMHLYGYDSSYRDETHHAYAQAGNDTDPGIDAYVNGRTYRTTAWMVAQVNEFKELSRQLADMGCRIVTHGDGLLPYVAWQMAALTRAAA